MTRRHPLLCDRRSERELLADLNVDQVEPPADLDAEGAGAFFVGAASATILGLFCWAAVLLAVRA